jgi:hypothetical protein
MNRPDYKYLYSVFNKEADGLKCYRYHKVKMTKNMGVLLDLLLRSTKFDKEGNFYIDVLAEDKKVLNTFQRFDVIDCYNRLCIDDLMFGDSISKESKNYVMDKMEKIGFAKGYPSYKKKVKK